MDMRPRISVAEAQYITELLQTSLEILKQHEAWVNDLKLNCFELEKLKRYDWVTAQKQGQKEKAQELDYWKRNLSLATSYHIEMHQALIQKYKGLASRASQPQAHHNNTVLGWRTRSGYEGTLKQVTEKQLTPLSELGKKERLCNA
jgi:hypothetical protein